MMAELEKIIEILEVMMKEINLLISNKKITKSFLAKKLEVSRPTLKKILKGNCKVEVLAELLEICRNYVVN